MSGGYEPAKARFWLLEAPDSLSAQNRREPDGTGIGKFTIEGHPELLKQRQAPSGSAGDRDEPVDPHDPPCADLYPSPSTFTPERFLGSDPPDTCP